MPKSMTMAGPPRMSMAATALAMRSAPTSRGFSVRIGMPVFTPASITTGRNPKYFSVISRRAAVTDGTTDEMAIPSTSSSKENPWKPRNSWIWRAYSSLVRRPLVWIRQWSRRPCSQRPTSPSSAAGGVSSSP